MWPLVREIIMTIALQSAPKSSASRQEPAGAAPQSSPAARLLFIDGLRGVAALLVMLFHFYTPIVSKLHYLLAPYTPAAVDWVLLQGYVGVEIFFVLSGFVIAYTLRNDVCTPKFAANFMIRRSIRLDPPYWAVIFLTIGYRCVLWHKYTSTILHYWGAGTILGNMFYVPDVMNKLLVVGVAWTLCLEVRFYLTIIITLMIAQRIRERFGQRAGNWTLATVFAAITIYSIFYRYGEDKMNFSGMWFMFAMGAVFAWTFSGKIRERWFWVLIGATLAGQLWRLDYRVFAAVGTILLIYLCARLGQMAVWLSWGWIQYLGKISYSLYLIHVAVGVAVIDIFLTYGDKSPLLALFAYISAIACSIIAADVLHKTVEAPCMRLAKRLKIRGPKSAAKPAPVQAAASRPFDLPPQPAMAV